MMALSHAGLGWAIGVAAPGSDRRLRMWCTAAGALADLGALAVLAGKPAYGPVGHNLFAGILCIAAAAWFFRRYPDRAWIAAVGFVTLSFASHLLVDMKLTGREIHLFWPLDVRGRQFPTILHHGNPYQAILAWCLVGLPWGLAFWKGATPLEIVSPGLDLLIMNLLRPRNRDCYSCGKKCNNRCHRCTRPVCFRHGKVGWHFRLTCPACPGKGAAPAKATEPSVEDYIAKQLQFFRGKEAMRLDPEFASFLHRKLTDGLRRLDDIPRTHPLWEGSDRRPTLGKLVELSKALLKDAPDDQESRWVLFADHVLKCSPDLEYAVIEPVILSDFASIRWLASAARWSFVFSGTDPVLSLREPFKRLGKVVGSLEDLLGALKTDPNAATRDAAGQCIDLLHGRNPFKA